jgi:hypothetical protein
MEKNLLIVIAAVVIFAGCGGTQPPLGELSDIWFSPPTKLPDAVVGKPYFYSFCLPALDNTSDLCGAFVTTVNPAGGKPPYSFQLDTMGNFPPFGISLNLNGILNGTPTVAGERKFTVCAVDKTRTSACQEVSLNVKESFTVEVTKVGSGNGTVTSYPDGINCGAVCNASFESGEEVSLSANEDETSVFAGWEEDCTGEDYCELIMDGNKEVTAKFAFTSVNITSAKCTDRGTYGLTYRDYLLEFEGTASGPEGVWLDFRQNLFSITPVNTACGPWSDEGEGDCQRLEGQPEAASWKWSFSILAEGAYSHTIDVWLSDKYFYLINSDSVKVNCG